MLVNLSGPVHIVFTVIGTSATGINSMVHVRVTKDLTYTMTEPLVAVTNLGVGTVNKIICVKYTLTEL